jgi:1,4-alpha-glucan branching enzyme
MTAQPGKKLLFMGAEIGQWREWSHDRSLDWHLLDSPPHTGIQRWVADANRLYCSEPAMHELDFSGEGFEWIDCNDADQSVISLIRKGTTTTTIVLVVCNFTPVPRSGYRIGVPRGGDWHEVLNSDATTYGGSGQGNLGRVHADIIECFGRPFSVVLTLPPLSVVFFRSEGGPIGSV